MSAPKARLSALPFPTVSIFAIYSSADLPDRPPEDPSSSGTNGREHKDETAQELAKVVFWHAQVDDISTERKARLMGTVRGMQDFARMLSAQGGDSVRSVHSLRQRMVWYEPEPGFSIHATIDLPRAPKHTRVSSATSEASAPPPSTLPLDDGALIAAMAHAYGQYRLRHGSFAGAVKAGGRQELVSKLQWWGEFVKRWRMDSADAGAFERTVGGLSQSTLAQSTSAQLDPLLAQFAASNSATAFILHNKSTLALPTISSTPVHTRTASLDSQPSSTSPTASGPPPSARPPRAPPPPLSEADLLALVAHIADRVIVAPPPPPLVPRPATPIVDSPTSATLTPNASSNSALKWYQLGLFADAGSGLPSVPLPAMPAMPSLSMPAISMPNMSIPNMSMPAMPSIPGLSGLSNSPATSSPLAQAAAVDANAAGASSPGKSAGWGGRSISWGAGVMGLGKHKKSVSSLSTVTPAVGEPTEHTAEGQAESGAPLAEGDEPTNPSPAEGDTPPTDEQSPEAVRGDTVTPPAQVAHSVMPGSAAAASPAVDLHREVDPIALAEAMASMEALAQLEAEEAQQATPKSGEEPDNEVQAETVVEVPTVAPSIRQVLEVFVGEGNKSDTQAEVWSFQRGAVTLALATLPLPDLSAAEYLESRAMRLLEAIESVLDTTPPPGKPYSYTHLVKTGPLASASGFAPADQHWSGKASADDQDATASLFESVRQASSHPPIVESLVRLASSQWIIRQKAIDPFAQTETDIYLNLPAKIGKEGSLVDAAEELRRLKRTVGVIGA